MYSYASSNLYLVKNVLQYINKILHLQGENYRTNKTGVYVIVYPRKQKPQWNSKYAKNGLEKKVGAHGLFLMKKLNYHSWLKNHRSDNVIQVYKNNFYITTSLYVFVHDPTLNRKNKSLTTQILKNK